MTSQPDKYTHNHIKQCVFISKTGIWGRFGFISNWLRERERVPSHSLTVQRVSLFFSLSLLLLLLLQLLLFHYNHELTLRSFPNVTSSIFSFQLLWYSNVYSTRDPFFLRDIRLHQRRSIKGHSNIWGKNLITASTLKCVSVIQQASKSWVQLCIIPTFQIHYCDHSQSLISPCLGLRA